MEELAINLQKKINNIKRLKPATRKRLISKYSKDMNIPEELFNVLLSNDMNSYIDQFKEFQNSDEAKKLDLDKLNLNNINKNNAQNYIDKIKNISNTLEENDSESSESDEDIDPFTYKINQLKKGDMKVNINKYIKENNLFSKTEKLVILLDPVLKEVLNINDNKITVQQLINIYNNVK